MSDEEEEKATKERAYYLRLVSMYVDVGTETVLGVFVHHSPGKDAEAFLKANESKIIRLKFSRILNEQECALLLLRLQDDTLVLNTPIDLKSFDVSLLITLARKLFKTDQLPQPVKGWNNPPNNNDKSIGADLIRLKKTRNGIVGHHPRARLPKWQFDDEWRNVSEIFLRLQQQIAPENEVRIKEKIEKYRVQKLDPSVENKYDKKLKEWHKEVTEIQDKVEELIEQLKDFDSYFKNKSDRFEKYTKLLLRGGHFVLKNFLTKKIEKEGKDLRNILDDKKDTLKTNITDSKQLNILYPPTNMKDSLDMSSWDISLLATVILQLLVRPKDRGIKGNVTQIGEAYKNYKDVRLVALDSKFEEERANLRASLQFVSDKLDEDKADKYYQILEECEKGILEHEDQTYMKKQASEMKKFKDTLQKTKDFFQDMITNGISFKNGHELELKMITLGNNEEKKKLAEEILTKVWLEAIDTSIQTTDYPEVKKEVDKILNEIKKSRSVKNITIQTACILLKITCTSPYEILNMLNYFESKICHESFVNISKELGYLLDTALTVYSVVPINWLWAISNLQSKSIQPTERGVKLPITVSSPAGMKQLILLCGSEEIANSTNAIADALSKHLDDTIELKTSADMKELRNVYDADKTSSDSGSDTFALESRVQTSNKLNHPDIPEECPEGKATDSMPEESTEQKLNGKTDHIMDVHKDDNNEEENEPVAISESDLTFSITERETKIQRYRNWVMSGLRLHIFKKKLNIICDKAVEKQHKEMIDSVKKKKGLSIVSCNKCSLQTLLPDHVQTKQKQCSLGYLNCNCLNPAEKSACPNNLCGALYDDIIRKYNSIPRTPFWENTNVHTWCTDPWSIAKCFISKGGCAVKTKAFEFDIKELFLLAKNSKIVRNTWFIFPLLKEDVLQQVCRHRDCLYYSKETELDWNSACEYRRAFNYQQFFRLESSEFPDDDYIVTTKDEALVHADVIAALSEEAKYLEQKITSCEETYLSEEKAEEESFQTVSVPPESKVERLEPGSSEQAVPAKRRRLDSMIYGHTHSTYMHTESKAGQELNMPYRIDHTAEDLEDYKIQLEKIKTLISIHKEKMNYIVSKIDIQKRLVKLYQDHAVKVPALPIQPEQNQKDIDDVYVSPWMTLDDGQKRKASTFCKLRENEIIMVRDLDDGIISDNRISALTFFEVLKNKGNLIKNVYVLGEAGTGKSMFCKSLVQKWCKVHMENDTGGLLNLGKKMKIINGFEFLFLILLRHHLDKPTIKMMLDSQYGHPVLQKILDTESDKCLILLDGLDEWIPKSLSHSQIQPEELPARDKTKEYTIVTTSRPWKTGLISLKTNDIHWKLILRGIGKYGTMALAEKTIKLLNATFAKDRSMCNFLKCLDTSPLSDIKHFPILVQQLICLWYENNDLTSSSRCTLYSGMLEVAFKWLDQRKDENHKSDIGSKNKDLPSLQVSHALDPARMYRGYKNTMNSASKLAFDLLFNKQNKNAVVFDIQDCKRLQIPVDVLKVCVNIGILYEDKNIGFTAVGQNESSFSFAHKSIQEFLAAVHIADIFKACSLPVAELEETTEQEFTTTLRHLSELDDTTYLCQVSWKDIAPQHLVSDLDDITNQHLRSEWEDITYPHSSGMPENIMSLHTSSGKDDIMSPQTGSEREHITYPYFSSQREDIKSPNTGSVPVNVTSPHPSSRKNDMQPLCTHSERDNTTSPHSRLEREDMSAPEYAVCPDPDVCEDFIRKIFVRIQTIENVLEIANVFVFLSGLQPRLASCISKYIYNIVNRSTLVIQHRTTLDDCAFLCNIQRCISDCCDEATSNATCARRAIYLGDCFIDDSKSVMPSLNSSIVQYIIPGSMKSLSVSFSETCPSFKGHSKCGICSVLTHLSSCRGLTKLTLDDERWNLDDGHLRQIKEILEMNLQSLRTVSVNYRFGMNSYEPLTISIPKINQLTSLMLKGIKLPHKQCNNLETYLRETVHLQALSLKIMCKDKDDHEIDMSAHDTLQYLEIGDGFTVKNVNTVHDMTVKFEIERSDDSSINPLFCILESVKLKYVSLSGDHYGHFASSVVTHKLRLLLTKSTYLYAIELDSLQITDNILTFPCRLVSLKRIDLLRVGMTKGTWKLFIESLPRIPNAVQVKTQDLNIIDSSSMLYESNSKLRIPKIALDYVRYRDKLFHITRVDNFLFEFSTHKLIGNGD